MVEEFTLEILYSARTFWENSKYEDLQISCFDWADKFKFGDGSLSVDKLTVTLVTDEYFEFLERAYD